MSRARDVADRSAGGQFLAVLRRLDNLLSPQTCALCNAAISTPRTVVCNVCREALSEIASAPYCGRCGRGLNPLAITEKDCARCRKERHWNIAGVVRIGSYPGELRKLVLGLKYYGRERNAAPLAEWLADALRRTPWGADIDLLVPVPMHWFRRVQRKCNHARVLADALGRATGIPVRNACRRIRHGPSQTAARSEAQRFANVKSCFGPKWRRNVVGKTVCIVDNLMATGATVCEVSKVLRKMGAKPIYAAVASRTILAGDFQADVR